MWMLWGRDGYSHVRLPRRRGDVAAGGKGWLGSSHVRLLWWWRAGTAAGDERLQPCTAAVVAEKCGCWGQEWLATAMYGFRGGGVVWLQRGNGGLCCTHVQLQRRWRGVTGDGKEEFGVKLVCEVWGGRPQSCVAKGEDRIANVIVNDCCPRESFRTHKFERCFLTHHDRTESFNRVGGRLIRETTENLVAHREMRRRAPLGWRAS